MSGRSFLRELVVVVIAVAACGKSGPPVPEADPVVVKQLAAKMMRELPTPAATRDCVPGDLVGGATMTFRTLQLLAGEKLTDKPENEDWINVAELDVAAARTLVADAKNAKAARQAAAQLLAAPFWVVYKVDLVNAPMALGVKELKIGSVGTRVVRYEKTGLPSCVTVFIFENTRTVAEEAIAQSDRATIDPAVAKRLRDDLAAQYVKLAPRGK